MSVSEGTDGKVLLTCHAGCAFATVVSAIGLKQRDLFPARQHVRPQHHDPGSGAKGCRPSGPLPSEELAAECTAALASLPKLLDKFAKERAISADVLVRHGLGWSRKRSCFTLPVRDASGAVVDIRRKPLGGGKGKSWPGSHVFLFGYFEAVRDNRPGPVYLCAGEWDALALLQRAPDRFVCGVPGEGTFKAEWVTLLKALGREVIITYDLDDAGRKGAAAAADKLAAAGVTVGLRNLPADLLTISAANGNPCKDLRDFFTVAGKTLADYDALPLQPLTPGLPPAPDPEELPRRIAALDVSKPDAAGLEAITTAVARLPTLGQPPIVAALAKHLKPAGYTKKAIMQAVAEAARLAGRAKKPAQHETIEAEFERGDEAEIADRLLMELQGDGPPLVTDTGDIHRYDPEAGIWRVVTVDEMTARVKRYAGAPVYAGEGKDGSDKTRPLHINKRHPDGAIKFLRATTARSGFFAEAPAGIAFRNAFVSVTADGPSPGAPSPDNRVLWSAPCDWCPEADAPRFCEYLAEVFAEDEDFEEKACLLQEFAGACLIGIAPAKERALILLGESARNGKSQFLDVLQGLFPRDSACAVTPQQMAEPNYRARLAGKRINIVNEMPEAGILAAECFKALVTGETVSAHHKYRDPFEFVPTAGHIFSANLLPKPVDLSEGFFRRWLIVTFHRRFGSEAEDKLGRRIVDRELAGLFAWAIAGAVRLLRQKKYTEPPSSVAAVEAWRCDADQVRQWGEARISRLRLPSAGTSAEDAWRDYDEWREATGHGRLSLSEFGKRLRRLYGKPTHTQHGNVYPFILLSRPAGAPAKRVAF
ncbi:MAG: toprim domain-containing protein [Candidatus Wallbacteria bacterium]|nr:toprim domain-containing protein [Candidatus Wallbacteria bacterium]